MDMHARSIADQVRKRARNRAPGQNAERGRERGATLVEFAIISSLLVAFILGVFEIGMAWSDHQVLTQSTRSGGRVVSQLGVRPQADQEALRAISAGLGTVNGQVTRVVVFEADGNGDMPAACETATAGYSGAGNCNVYDSVSLANLDTAALWGSGSSCGTADGNWCPVTARNDAQATASFIGVQVEMQRDYLTGFFGGGSHTMVETTVMRIEPGI